MNFLKGRANRASYWVGLATLVVLMAILMVVAPSSAHIQEIVLIYLAVPRLHDIGRTGWWAAAVLGLEIALTVVAFVTLPEEQALSVTGVMGLAIFGLMVWLGSIPGEPAPNRFGDPPARGLQFRRQPKAG